MRRREFIAGPGGTAAWPLVARAQQGERMRRVGALMNREAGDPEGQAYLMAFQHALQQLGWMEGRNLRIDTHWGANDVDRDRKYAAELVAGHPLN
jgi:putative ABC transport system substrate-binding protein